MELGFNFKDKKIEAMSQYEVKNYLFDYENFYNSLPLNAGFANLEELFREIISEISPQKNYSIVLTLQTGDEFLSYEEYFTLFSAFTFALTLKGGIDNQKGYLSVPEDFRNKIVGANYSVLKMFTHDYEYGTIQFIIVDGKETEVKWVNNKSVD